MLSGLHGRRRGIEGQGFVTFVYNPLLKRRAVRFGGKSSYVTGNLLALHLMLFLTIARRYDEQSRKRLADELQELTWNEGLCAGLLSDDDTDPKFIEEVSDAFEGSLHLIQKLLRTTLQ